MIEVFAFATAAILQMEVSHCLKGSVYFTDDGKFFVRTFVISHGVIEPVAVHLLRLLDEALSSHPPFGVGALFATVSFEVHARPLLEVTMNRASHNYLAIIDWSVNSPPILVGIAMNFYGSFNKGLSIHVNSYHRSKFLYEV